MSTDRPFITLDSKFGGSGMTMGEVVTRFKQAKDRRQILQVLSDESGLTVETVRATLIAAGVDYKLFPRAKRKPDVPEVKPEDQKKFQAERDRPKPQGKAKPEPEPAPVVTVPELDSLVEILRAKVNRYNELMVEAGRIRQELDQIREILEVLGKGI